MIAELVRDIFIRTGTSWRVSGKYIVPEEESIEKVLDQAASSLYDEVVGTRFETTGLIIEKTRTGHDVYVYVGNYA